ncbi:RNA polymerase sigma factor (sigma-70 family) [Flavobacterium sp. PL11]|jgi:RNA polymerase sigma factor (sigma-70 family)|uniref:sigma-70 family RNA polymerase sigma factor n=1 Tax=Flavobacterium sp. PL11 TaxID=3071717 RepID=UPI002E024D0B|nr:RNA polymerase sigma factor (sigma-70 family) [Flavobacterium sp. PL11]
MGKIHNLTIIEHLKEGNKDIIHKVYVDNKNAFLSYALKYDLLVDDVLDIYQDSIVALCENAKKGTIDTLQCGLSTYLFSIGKYMIYRKLKALNRNVSIDYDFQMAKLIECGNEEMYDDKSIKSLQTNFKKLGKQCQKILHLFYYEGKKLDEIKTQLNYTNKDV